jgi:hypothetical protein
MGSIITLRNEIEAVINGMDGVDYLRARPDEANIALDNMSVTNCLAIHIDQTTVTTERALAGSYVVKVIPTQILFVYKNTDLDEKTRDVDTLIDQAEDKADEFFDLLIRSEVISDVVPLPVYELERLEAYKRFDAILSGVLFSCDFPTDRKTYYCQ